MAFAFKPTAAGFQRLSGAMQGKGGGGMPAQASGAPAADPSQAGGGTGGMDKVQALLASLQGGGEAEEDPFLAPAPIQAPNGMDDATAQLLASLGASSGLSGSPQAAPARRPRFGFGGGGFR